MGRLVRGVTACRRLAATVAVLVAVGGLAAQPAAARDSETSLRWIPKDAAFYRAMLRNREQVEAVVGSRAWSRLRALPVWREAERVGSMPLVGVAWQQLRSRTVESQPVARQIESLVNDPQTQRLLELLEDMVSHEVFVYGDEGFVALADLANQVARDTLCEPAVAHLAGDAEPGDASRELRRRLVHSLAQNADRFRLPNLVAGFKVSDTNRAAEQLGKFELVLGLICWGDPQLRGRMGRERIDGNDYLTLSLDGGMIPWDDLAVDAAEPERRDIEQLTTRLKTTRLVIAVGLKEDYLLVSVGPSTDGLAALGTQKRLIDLPEMAPMRRFADKCLTSICYRSKAFRASLTPTRACLAALAETIDRHVAASGLEPPKRERLQRDLAALGADLEPITPEAGSLAAVTFLTDRGIESYSFDRSEHPWRAGCKPLAILDHVGGDPLVVVSYRGTCTPAGYDVAVKWLRVGYGYFDDHVLWRMDPPWRKTCRVTAAVLFPVLRQADEFNRQVLIPTLADGQIVFVVDAKRHTPYRLGALPGMERPMPLVEPALVLDAGPIQRVREMFHGELAFYDDLRDAWEDVPPSQRTSVENRPTLLPNPTASSPDAGRWFAPTLGYSDDAIALTLSADHARRLLEATPFRAGDVLAKPDRARATVAMVHWAGVVEAATPWVDLGVQKLVLRVSEGDDAATIRQRYDLAAEHVHAVLDCLAVLRRVSRETYVEDDALVTHTLWELHDLDDAAATK